MIVERFPQTAFQQNTRVVACEATMRAICIDPGESSPELVAYINDRGLTLQAIALTHGHLDHIGGTSAMYEAFPEAEIIIHEGDAPLYYGLPRQPLMMGVPESQLEALGLKFEPPPQATRYWQHGETYEVGDLRFSVRHCPGHTPGHVVLAEENLEKVFVGDCLFYGSIGRTDLPGGDHEQLLESIERNIMSLPDETVVYSGHGPETTVGRERRQNPFLNGTYGISRGRYD